MPQAEYHTLAPAATQQTQDLAPTNSPATATEACTAYRIVEHLRHKNRLQEYTQKASLRFPLYQTINEGSHHSPRFRSTVIVDGKSYTSPNTFSNRKTAEQEVARFALESITKKIQEEGCSLLREDTVLCKSILYEFAMKVNLGMPVYTITTYQLNGRIPGFKSSLVFDGVLYNGKIGSSKKEAEQLAAREAIFSFLGTSGHRTTLFEIIKSKVKFLAALHKGGEELIAKAVETGTTNYNMTMSAVQGANSGISVPPVETTTTNYNALTVPVQGANPGISLHPHHQFSIPGPEPSAASANLPIQVIGPNSQLWNQAPEKQKKKKKANKKLHTDAQ